VIGALMAHRGAYHGLRSPGYLVKAAGWALYGLVLCVERARRWWWVAEQTRLRSLAVISGDSREWRNLHKDAKNSRRDRGLVLLAAVFAIALAATLMWQFAPWWGWVLLAAVLLPLLARAGRPADKPIIRPATTTPRFRVLNSDVVLRAYYSAGLGHPDKPGQQITFGAPMSRDGDGSRVLVDLPYGKGLDDAVKSREAIASGLDVTLSQVFITRDATSHRRHTLWVADRDPLAVPVGRTPLLACKPADIWKPAPFGLDERGQLVTVPLMWNSILISALPRAGKTFSARLLALYAALDPYVKLSVFDAKGSPDWRKFALVADRYAFGLTPTRDGMPVEILMDTLTEIRRDVEDRYHRLSEMPVSICPEGKLTREIARDPRYQMPVRVIVLEEFQEYFDVGKASADIASLLVFLIKVAPGAGVILIDATQRPSGVGGGGQVGQQFISFRDNHALRFGLRTSSWQVSELCLGAGAYSEGLDTSALLPGYRGVGILRGASDASPTVRTYLADGGDAERVLTAARALRQRAGTLSGMAAGMESERDGRDVLADVMSVFGTDSGLQWQSLAARLDAHIPGRWADTAPEAISAECRARGVPSVDVKQLGRALKGCRRADVERAAGKP
jgi:S-DNA-T family DNA segregation ATPase FtsK/SpoIIIE